MAILAGDEGKGKKKKTNEHLPPQLYLVIIPHETRDTA